VHWYRDVLKKYAIFSCRARRQEFWTFMLFNYLIGAVLALTEGATGMFESSDVSVLASIYQLIILVPSIAVGVRRMHDTDHRGWWLAVPLVNLIFAVTDGTPRSNQFGPDPKGARGPAV
jgi:uncharacterized membrane protein YhaH (DUF805 family)